MTTASVLSTASMVLSALLAALRAIEAIKQGTDSPAVSPDPSASAGAPTEKLH